ncbi:hypothetical protein [Azospirillum sp. ST 5-10]|uniref:hypothetical protein n=1 Tax=unclassified Azospirillum TaxID=2630922 RepID=UPI003F4A6755
MPNDDADTMMGNMLLHVNLLAMRALLVKVMEELFRRSDDPAAKADEWLRLFDRSASRMTFPDASPEWSDLAAQEFRDILVQTIGHARSLAVPAPAASRADAPRDDAAAAPRAAA